MQCVATHLLHTVGCINIIRSDTKVFDINVRLYCLLLLGSPHFYIFSKTVQITEYAAWIWKVQRRVFNLKRVFSTWFVGVFFGKRYTSTLCEGVAAELNFTYLVMYQEL